MVHQLGAHIRRPARSRRRLAHCHLLRVVCGFALEPMALPVHLAQHLLTLQSCTRHPHHVQSSHTGHGEGRVLRAKQLRWFVCQEHHQWKAGNRDRRGRTAESVRTCRVQLLGTCYRASKDGFHVALCQLAEMRRNVRVLEPIVSEDRLSVVRKLPSHPQLLFHLRATQRAVGPAAPYTLEQKLAMMGEERCAAQNLLVVCEGKDCTATLRDVDVLEGVARRRVLLEWVLQPRGGPLLLRDRERLHPKVSCAPPRHATGAGHRQNATLQNHGIAAGWTCSMCTSVKGVVTQ
jgi:hypothetical protein